MKNLIFLLALSLFSLGATAQTRKGATSKKSTTTVHKTTTSSSGTTGGISEGILEDGHRYVDLGLPSGTLWATCNVGAARPEDYGDYYAWGEVATKASYNWDSYKWQKDSIYFLTKYCTNEYHGAPDGKTHLVLSDDAANANWKGGWRMPTAKQVQELKDNCIWKWTAINDHHGYRVESKTNHRAIFLPAAGLKGDEDLGIRGLDVTGSYMTSDVYENDGGPVTIDFDPWTRDISSWSPSFAERALGRSVRPVFVGTSN